MKFNNSKSLTWSCNRRCSGWKSGQGSSLRRWTGTGTGSPGQWSWYQACWSSGSVWTTLSMIWSDFWLVLRGTRSWTWFPYESLSTQDILWPASGHTEQKIEASLFLVLEPLFYLSWHLKWQPHLEMFQVSECSFSGEPEVKLHHFSRAALQFPKIVKCGKQSINFSAFVVNGII